MSSPPPTLFGAAHAEVYDRQFVALAAIKDALHLLVQIYFSRLPADARILVVGAGTGAEARHLARAFPSWRFTLVDPAEAMLAVCRRHALAEGFADRCDFHEGYVSSLSAVGFDAATSVLASHFLTVAADRRAYFADIATRLKPGGLFVNVDLAADPDDASFEGMMNLWLDLRQHASVMPDDGRSTYRAAYGRDFAAHGPGEVEAMIAEAGFTAPALCYQVALIRGWVASRR